MTNPRIATFVIVLGCISCSRGMTSLPKAQCGPTNDMQNVSTYEGSLSVSKEFVAQHKGPVGLIRNLKGKGYCTGTLISPNLLLTARHCIEGRILDYTVYFNDAADIDETPVKITAIAERGSILTDYALLELEGTPGETLGKAKINAAAVPNPGDPLVIIQFPKGGAKQVATGTLSDEDELYWSYGDLDTLAGASGAGILTSAGELIGIHTNGQCYEDGGANRGIKISRAYQESSLLQSLFPAEPKESVPDSPLAH